MFEYMASGRAIVSADLPSIREVLNEGNAAFCEPGEIGNWRLEIESLLADEPRRLALSAQARNALRVEQLSWVKREEKVMGYILSNLRKHK
jgi:glycosyltransferase involved in cell wall biosynthesis